MNKRLLSFTIISSLALFVFTSISYSNRNFAPVGNTTAPGENTCAKAGCHATFGTQTNMSDRISISIDGVEMDANFEYTRGASYNMNLTINNARDRNGFSLTILNSSDELVGTLATSSNDAQVTNGANGKRYVGHTNSLGVSTWDFEWTAPADSQSVTLYSIVNISNNNNNTSGDSILTKSIAFTALADTTTTDTTTATSILSRSLTEQIQVINALGQEGVAFNIDVNEVKYFNCEIIDLNGTIVFTDKYFLHKGKHQIFIPVLNKKGLFFLRVSSGQNSSSFKFVN